MAQFDVYVNPNRATAEDVPYLLDIQNELLDTLATRVVVPLYSALSFRSPARVLNPVFDVEGRSVVMSTAELAGVSTGAMGSRVTSLSAHRDDIVRAFDLLISGV